MSGAPGHKSGHAPGFTWGDYLEQLVSEHGTLTQVAWKLIDHSEDVANIERALRRLRTRGQRDGGAWGQRLIRAFGVPHAIVERVRWLGLYHSPFQDLPLGLCLDQLRLWDRPPIVNTRARVWLQLGFASTALRQRDFATAAQQLDRADAASPDPEAQLEATLARAYLVSRDDAAEVPKLLDRAATLLREIEGSREDQACFSSRITDQRAFALNREKDHNGALSLYRALPSDDVHPFASYRRDAGLAYGEWRTGNSPEATRLANQAITHAGDGGYIRLRAMGLLMLAKVSHDPVALLRAEAIATRLGDTELATRANRLRSTI